ncbi:DUF1829 domain-containing protein [candidate division KSB1 bacterium]|nr:DUF1829 domain-containing protein [candidate division KSB1 bacterium]
MINEIKILIDNYINWLRDKTILQDINGHVEITTPFMDRHNDYIQIYINKDKNGNYLLTDDGYTITDLEFTGFSFDSSKRQELLKTTLSSYGVQLVKNDLTATATVDNFALKKHNLIQSILAVNDLFYLSSPYVASLFLEDVAKFLNSNEVRYTPNVKFSGKSGYDHLFDFVIPASKVKPERIIKTINRPSKQQTESFLFAWLDTRDIRPKDSTSLVFLNDSEAKPLSNILSSFKSYKVTPIPWSGRDNYIKELVS